MSQDNRQLPKTLIEGNTPLDLKGKGKQTMKENTIPIVDRLQSSGRLVLDAFGSGPELNGQQPARKADPSGSNSNSIDKISSSTGEASSHRLRSSIQAESLRSMTNLDSGPSAQAFNDFVSADVTLDVDNDNDNANLDEEVRKQIYHSKSTHASQDVSEQEELDGAAVVSLLDGHSDELDAVLVGSHDPIAEAEADDDPLTPEAAAKLREALFSNNSASSGPSLSDLLNFNPGFLDQPGREAELERQLYLGTRDTDQARSSWLQQWGDVLAGYTDHVWGDLEPLIAEARREVEESKAQGPGAVSETKALDRLRQVLAHIRGV